MKKDQTLENEFSVEELESRFEMKGSWGSNAEMQEGVGH